MSAPDQQGPRDQGAPRRPFGATTPVVWRVLSKDEQEHQLALLIDWVNWLVERYRLDQRTIPRCWPEHGELIEELAALHLAWQGAYARLAVGDGPLRWHEHFALARSRLAECVARSGCRASEHRLH